MEAIPGIWIQRWTAVNPGICHVVYGPRDTEALFHGTMRSAAATTTPAAFQVDSRSHEAGGFPGYKHTHPHWWEVYQRYPHWVQRADFARLLWLYHHGGVYTDMDTSCEVPLRQWTAAYPELASATAVFTWDRGRAGAVQNWTMVAAPRHPLLAAMLDHLTSLFPPGRQLPLNPFTRFETILDTTGPKACGEALRAAPAHLKDAGVVLPEAPLFGGEVRPLLLPGLLGPSLFSRRGKRGTVLVQHHFTGTWSLAGPRQATVLGVLAFMVLLMLVVFTVALVRDRRRRQLVERVGRPEGSGGV